MQTDNARRHDSYPAQKRAAIRHDKTTQQKVRKKLLKGGKTEKLGGNPTSHTPAHDMTAAAAPFRA
jgi:hypothetical protein